MHSKFKVDYHNFNLDPHDVEMIQFLKQSLLDEFKHEPI